MCGIAGILCTKDYDPRLGLTLTLLALEMQNRGRQSWGWTDGDQIVKSTGPIMDDWNHTLIQSCFKAVAMHTRHATVGGITAENAHPYKIGNILGMHNGVVYNHSELNRKYDRNHAVDSMHIFSHINEGLDLSEIEAYGAVCFWKDGKVHIGRWNGGELTLARTPFGWAWASTRKALQTALERGGFESCTYLRLKEGRCYELDGDKLLKSDIKLNFSTSATKSYKWNDSRWSSSPANSTTTGTNTTTGPTGSGRSSVYRWDDAKQDFIPTQTASGNSEPNTVPLNRRYTEQDILTAAEAGSVDERIGEILDKVPPILDATPNQGTQPVSEKNGRPSTAAVSKWKCAYCTQQVVGDYYISGTLDVVCEDCGARYIEAIAYGPFKVLPKDLYVVEALFDNDDLAKKNPTWECEECTDRLDPKDFVVETLDGLFICVECWREQAMNSQVREEQDIKTINQAMIEAKAEDAQREAAGDSDADSLLPDGEVEPLTSEDDPQDEADKQFVQDDEEFDQAVEEFRQRVEAEADEGDTSFDPIGMGEVPPAEYLEEEIAKVERAKEQADLAAFCNNPQETQLAYAADRLSRNDAANLKQFGAAIPNLNPTQAAPR